MKIVGIGSAMPSLVVTNDMLSEFLDTSDEWIVTRTGIKTRRIISTENLVMLATDAANKALEKAGLSPLDIDYIICSNTANNYVTPSLSSIIQGEIKAQAPCIDINGACTGFINGLAIANAFIAAGQYKNILIVAAEEPTRFCNWQERDTCVLFGDGAAAAVVTVGNALKTIHLNTSSYTDVLYYRRKLEPTPFLNNNEQGAPLVMNGRELFKVAVSASIEDVKFLLKEAGLTPDDIDHYLIHQSNKRMVESIRQFLNQPEEKFPMNIDTCGNTASASIPILMDELCRKKVLKKGDTLLLSSFGGGFTSAAAILTWEMED